jgi:hypothetical protein
LAAAKSHGKKSSEVAGWFRESGGLEEVVRKMNISDESKDRREKVLESINTVQEVILDGIEHEGQFPAISKIRVTTVEDLRKAKDGQLIEEEATKPPKFADTGLFDFDEKSDTKTD